MPPTLKPNTTPRPSRIGVEVTLKINLGNYEAIDMKYTEEYPIGDGADPEMLRRTLFGEVRSLLDREGAKLVKSLVPGPLPDPHGKSPAGQLAVHFKNLE